MERTMIRTILITAFLFVTFVLYPESSEEGNTGVENQLTKEERALLESLQPLQVIVDDNFIPITYYNEKTGEFEGIAVEVLKTLSLLLDFQYEIIRDTSLSWSDRLDLIKRDKVHILGGASRNDRRREYGYFTEEEYFTVNYALIKRIDNHLYISHMGDISNARIGLVEGVTLNSYIQDHTDNTATLLLYKTQKEAMKALDNREIDIVPYNEAVFKEEFFKGELLDYEIAYSIKDIRKEYAFFCPKTNEGKMLTEILDKGMKQIKIDTIIADRYQNKSSFAFYKDYLETIKQRNTIKNLILAFLIAAAIATLIIIIILKAESTKKEKLILKLEQMRKQLQEKATHDALTGLPNRLLFYDRLDQIMARTAREKIRFAILFIDLDDFKVINDTRSHDTGDKVLKEVGKRLKDCIRKCDTIARMGGDEFTAIITDIQDNRQVEEVAERMTETVTSPIHLKSGDVQIGLCIGISLYPDHSKKKE